MAAIPASRPLLYIAGANTFQRLGCAGGCLVYGDGSSVVDRRRLILLEKTGAELSTSPLPMECSTTELRQHAPDTRIGQKASTERADPCHKAPGCASARAAREGVKSGHDQVEAAAAAFNWASCGPIRFPISSPSAASALIGRIMTSNSVISPASLNLMRSMPLSCHLPILAENSGAAPLEPAIKLPSVYSPPVRLWKRCQFGRVYDER